MQTAGLTRTRLDRKIMYRKTFSHLRNTRILRVLNLFCTLYSPLQYKPKREQCEQRFPAANNTQMRFCKELHIITDPSIKLPAGHLNKQIPFTQAEHEIAINHVPGSQIRRGKQRPRVQIDGSPFTSCLNILWRFWRRFYILVAKRRANVSLIASTHITVALRSNFVDGYRKNMVFWIWSLRVNVNAFDSQRKSLWKSLALVKGVM